MTTTVNRQGLADAMGASVVTIDNWVREGCPVKTRGRKGVQWEFDLPEVVKWWGNRERENGAGADTTDEKELRRRALVATTGKAELEFAIAKGEVAPVREFERTQSKVMAAIQANVMNVAARSALRLLGETNETTFKQVMREELTLALAQSAEAEFSEDEDEDEDEGEGEE